MRLPDNLYGYVENLNLIERLFFDFKFFYNEVQIVNIVPMIILFWMLSILIINNILKINLNKIILLLISLAICGGFYSYLTKIKTETYEKIKKDKIYNCSYIDPTHFYINDEQLKCLRINVNEIELKNNQLSIIENLLITNKEEIFKDLSKDIKYNFIFIIIVLIIVFAISQTIVTLLFGKRNKKYDRLVDGTMVNPRDYPLGIVIITIIYLLSINFLNSDNINHKRLNFKTLELFPNPIVEIKKEVEIVKVKPIEFTMLKDIIKDKYTLERILTGRIDEILKLNLENINIDNFKSFMKNKDIENSYFGNFFKYCFYENKNLALNNEKLSYEYQKKANTILINEVKNNKAKFLKDNSYFFGEENHSYNRLIENSEIKDLETKFYLNSISMYKLDMCKSINENINVEFKIMNNKYSKKDIQEIIKISEKYNCYNKYRTLKLDN